MIKNKRLQVILSQYEMRKFIDAKIDQNLTARQVIEISSRPCDCCKGKIISIKCETGEVINIERGIFYKNSKNP
jgi:hypothetical protein